MSALFQTTSSIINTCKECHFALLVRCRSPDDHRVIVTTGETYRQIKQRNSRLAFKVVLPSGGNMYDSDVDSFVVGSLFPPVDCRPAIPVVCHLHLKCVLSFTWDTVKPYSTWYGTSNVQCTELNYQ